MPFLLNEDQALRSLLTGITVADEKNSLRPVGVWFGLPDPEIRPVTFPYFTIDLLKVADAPERAVSGNFTADFEDTYVPEGVLLPTDYTTVVTSHLAPQPFDLHYSVTTWSRFPRQDRQLLSILLSTVMPFKYGQISIPQDKSVRRLDLTDVSQAHMLDSDGKRIFRNVFSLSMSSELFVWQLGVIETVWSSAIIQGGPDIGAMTPINVTVTPATPVSPIIFSP